MLSSSGILLPLPVPTPGANSTTLLLPCAAAATDLKLFLRNTFTKLRLCPGTSTGCLHPMLLRGLRNDLPHGFARALNMIDIFLFDGLPRHQRGEMCR